MNHSTLPRSSSLAAGALAVAVVLTAGASLARADVAAVRRGATFGIALGAGHIGCSNADGDDCDGDGANSAGGISVHGGAMVRPAMALMGEVWGMAHTDDNVTTSQTIVAAQLRFWAGQMVWLQGGIGLARSTVRYDGDLVDLESRSDTVPALTAGLGVELVSSRTFGLDLQLKGGTGLYQDDVNIYNVSLGVGANWY